MRIGLFYRSLLSNWNHGNAHFLRGIASELLSRGHEVAVFEPADSWSPHPLLTHYGEKPVQPGTKILAANDGKAVAEQLRQLTPDRARCIGQAAYRRVLAEHTSGHRADQLEKVLEGHGRQAAA